MSNIRIHSEDTVMVITGKDRGKFGKVRRVFRSKNSLLVEGVHMVKRHMRKNPYTNQPGQIIDKIMPVHVSNVMLVCPSCGLPTRVGFRFVEKDGQTKKVRFCKKCNEVIARGNR
ncbi:MAG: 50S ribosomal protein L24 [Desulfovibrionaceae bacterium]|nr:50S ribosomal protein L24 [Desulfovibrionaceae bacterium]